LVCTMELVPVIACSLLTAVGSDPTGKTRCPYLPPLH
jgi:hypothetical protein